MFQEPQSISQDLLLIHSLVDNTTSPSVLNSYTSRKFSVDESIKSSDSESDSGDEVEEIEADLRVKEEESEKLLVLFSNIANISDKLVRRLFTNSDVDTDTASSDCDCDLPTNLDALQCDPEMVESEDEEVDGVPLTAVSGTYMQTKNEVMDSDIAIPDIEAVGLEEELELVGEVISIMEMAVIVKGAESEVANRAAGRALDSGTLLVFSDRKVLGYVIFCILSILSSSHSNSQVYETFGPTSQPLYQVKFNHAYPLDLEKVQISRTVFHVPQRSHFVFLNQVSLLRGSDASNAHDEEPADDELEFSDDEKEAAFKSSLKRRSVCSSSYNRSI
jgi:H/ACA ribonucleoprotein complex non-core subunit NAF1